MATTKHTLKGHEAQAYALNRRLDGAPEGLIRIEMVSAGADDATVDACLEYAAEAVSRAFDERDIHAIREVAFAADSLRQRRYRERIHELVQTQRSIRDIYGDAAPDKELLDMELAIDRSIQQYDNLAHRGRRDLPVAFAPKGILQDQAPTAEDDIDDAVRGALEG